MSTLSAIAALLFSVLLLIGGNSLVSVLTPLRARLDGFSELTIGLLGSVYSAGMLAGTLAAPALIRRAGHVRAFSAFVAVAAVSILLMPLFRFPWAWLACRALIGFVFAGIYAVVESWINAKATNTNRGALYAIYQIVNFGASAGGQLALRPLGADGFEPFVVAGIFFALSILPMAMTNVDPPAAPLLVRPRLLWLARLAPVSFCAALAAGATNGSVVALGPIFALDIGMRASEVPVFTSALVIGSALGVYPVGRLSDRLDRRLVMAMVMMLGAVAEVLLSRLAAPGWPVIALGFCVGLTTYTLYTLAASHANDRASPHDLIHISVGLLFVYCVGAIAAPALASLLMRANGPQALFQQNAYVHVAIAAFALWRLIVDPALRRPDAAERPAADVTP